MDTEDIEDFAEHKEIENTQENFIKEYGIREYDIHIDFTNKARILLTEKRDTLVSYLELYKNELVILENNVERILFNSINNTPIFEVILIIDKIKLNIKILEYRINKYNNLLSDNNNKIDITYFMSYFDIYDMTTINKLKSKCNIV
jgi:hypothetical protein